MFVFPNDIDTYMQALLAWPKVGSRCLETHTVLTLSTYVEFSSIIMGGLLIMGQVFSSFIFC